MSKIICKQKVQITIGGVEIWKKDVYFHRGFNRPAYREKYGIKLVQYWVDGKIDRDRIISKEKRYSITNA